MTDLDAGARAFYEREVARLAAQLGMTRDELINIVRRSLASDPLPPAPTLRLVLPGNPLSQNRAYHIVVISPRKRKPHATLALTPEGSAYKTRIFARALEARPQGWAIGGVYDLECVYYFDSRRPDSDGPGKLTRDALEGALYENDRQVRDFVQRKRLDREHPRLDITLRLVSPAQGELL